MTYSNLERITKDLKTLEDQLKTINKQEDSKGLRDSFLITGDLDDLEEASDLIEEARELLDKVTSDPTPIY